MAFPQPSTDTQNTNHQKRIRVVIPGGDLLCKYNEQTREIEIMPARRGRTLRHRKIWCIPTDELRSLGARNCISDKPVYVFKVTKFLLYEKDLETE